MATNTLLPDPDQLELERIDAESDSITLIVRTAGREATCPHCRRHSTRIHSRYTRTIGDLPWSGVAVSLRLFTRRFFCTNANCEQRIFTERLPALVVPYGRRTKRLEHALYLIGYVLGGEAGARLAMTLGMKISPDTLLRRVRQATNSSTRRPRVLGVDDWAWCKGQRYGTILVDLEERCLADLLPDYTSNSLGAWLKEHPGVEVISRDRSKVYREGIKQGAPQAVQVADRWHLLKNLGDTLERMLSRYHRHLREAAKRASSHPTDGAGEYEPPAIPEELVRPPPRAVQESMMRRERRLARYNQVMELYHRGISIRQITRTVGMSRQTVRKWIRADGFPERAQRRHYPSKVDPYVAYLRRRWEEGCHNAAQLWREIAALGYTGSASVVRHHLASWRPKLPVTQQRTRGPSPFRRSKRLNPSSRATMWLLLKQSDESGGGLPHREEDVFDRRFVERLLESSPEIKSAQELAQQFQIMVKERDVSRLDGWIAAAIASDVQELQGFAKGLVADKEAVEAALSYGWSNGQTEGQIHRLKLIKRSMYGRANFDLLRARVLPAVV